MYAHSVQADLISMKPEPIHCVCPNGAQADTPSLYSHPDKMIENFRIEKKVSKTSTHVPKSANPFLVTHVEHYIKIQAQKLI